MGLDPCLDDRWAKSNDTSGSKARGQIVRRQVEGGGVGEGELVKGITDVSNTKSYLPCKSAFVNATFVDEKRKKNWKEKEQSIAAVSETA